MSSDFQPLGYSSTWFQLITAILSVADHPGIDRRQTTPKILESFITGPPCWSEQKPQRSTEFTTIAVGKRHSTGNQACASGAVRIRLNACLSRRHPERSRSLGGVKD